MRGHLEDVENCVIAGFAGTSGANGHGINFASAGQLYVKDTIIRGNGNVGIWVTPSPGTARASVDHCRLEANQYGLISDPGGKVTMRDSLASGNSDTGLLAYGELNAEGCLVANNNLGLSSAGTLRASNCTVTDNTLYGLYSWSGGSLLSRSNNTVRGNASNGSFTGTFAAD